MRRAIRWVSGVVIVLLLLLALSTLYLCGTESGTRWLLGQAQPYLPDALDTGTLSGTLLGGLRAQGLSWTDSSARVAVNRLEFSIALRPLFRRQVSVRKFDADGIDIALLQSGKGPESEGPFVVDLPLAIEIREALLRNITVTRNAFSRRIDTVHLGANLRGSRLSVSRFDISSAWLETSLAGNGRLEAPYPAEFALTWRLATGADAEFAGNLTVAGRSDDYTVEHTLRAPFTVSTRGMIAFQDGEIQSDLTNRWEVVSIAAGDNRIESRDGRLSIAGKPSRYRLSGDATIKFDDWPVSHVELDGEGNVDGLRVAALQVESDLGQLSASGDFNWQPLMSWDMKFVASELDPARVSESLQGSVNVTGLSVGQLDDGKPQLRVDLQGIDGTLNGQPVDGRAAATIDGAIVNIEEADVSIGENRVKLSGRASERIDLNVMLRVPRIGTLVDAASGQLQGDLRIHGVVGDMSVSGSVSGASLSWRDYRATSLDARGELAMSGAFDATIEATALAYGQYVTDTAMLRLHGSSDRHRLQVQVRAPGNELDFAASGALADREWDGEIRTLNLRGDGIGDWTASRAAKLHLAAARLSMDRLCLDDTASAGEACFAASWTADSALDFDMSVDELPLTSLPLPLPPGVEVAGAIRVAGRGQVVSKRMNASASVDISNASFSADYEGEKITAAFEEGILTATVDDNRLSTGLRVRLSDEFGNVEGTLNMDDVFDLQSAIDGSASLDVNDLSIFPILLPSVTDTRGRIDGSIAISGTALQPELLGAIALRDGAFVVRRAGVAVTDVNVEVRQGEPGQLGISGSAHSGEGTVTVAGSTYLASPGELAAKLDINGENFEIIRLPDWRVSASPDISVSLDNSVTTVTGDVRIPFADLAINTIPETAERTSPDAIVHLAETTDETVRRRIDINVNARLGDDVRVQAFGLQTGLDGAVNIKGGTHSPYLGFGRLILRDGRFKAYGQLLQIERGELIFNGPLNMPNMDVRAVRPVDDVVAGVHLTGTPRQLESTVFSQPQLSDAEALSYLLTGRPLASASSGEGAMLNKAAFALGLSQAGVIASQIQGTLGLDLLTVGGSAEESEIVAGKRINERLFVEYGYGLVNNLGRLLLRYQLTQRLVVVSTSGVTNAVDVVYSVKRQ